MSQTAKAELEAIMNMYRQRRYDECLKEVKSKLKQSPNSLHLLNYQAMAYTALKRDKEALLSYQKIIKRDRSLAGPYYNMGIILKRNGRIEEAIANYKKAISLVPLNLQSAVVTLKIVYGFPSQQILSLLRLEPTMRQCWHHDEEHLATRRQLGERNAQAGTNRTCSIPHRDRKWSHARLTYHCAHTSRH